MKNKKDYLNNLIPGDGLRVLEPVDDAATVNWGDNWRMPTKEELYEFPFFRRFWTENKLRPVITTAIAIIIEKIIKVYVGVGFKLTFQMFF